MNTCKTCKWYKIPNAHFACECPKMIYGYWTAADAKNDETRIEDDEGWA